MHQTYLTQESQWINGQSVYSRCHIKSVMYIVVCFSWQIASPTWLLSDCSFWWGSCSRRRRSSRRRKRDKVVEMLREMRGDLLKHRKYCWYIALMWSMSQWLPGISWGACNADLLINHTLASLIPMLYLNQPSCAESQSVQSDTAEE